MRSIFVFAICAFMLNSCKKPDEAMPCTTELQDCIELEAPEGLGWNFSFDNEVYFQNPCFNPNNENELVFEFFDFSSSQSSVFKLNLSSSEKTLLFTGELLSPCSWSSSDQIYFVREDFNVWKMNDDGTELVQVTFEGCYTESEANHEGDLIASRTGLCGEGFGHTFIDSSGAIDFQTLNSCGGFLSWSPLGKLAGINAAGLKVLDPVSDQYLFNSEVIAPGAGGVFWLSEEEVMWSKNEGIFITNITTAITEEFLPSCSFKVYQSPSYCPAKNTVVWSKVTKTRIDETTLFVKSELVSIDLNDGSEEVIQIP